MNKIDILTGRPPIQISTDLEGPMEKELTSYLLNAVKDFARQHGGYYVHIYDDWFRVVMGNEAEMYKYADNVDNKQSS